MILLAATGLLLASCSATDTTGTCGSGAAPDPGTGHLHGLGVGPADGTV
ncbi:hypothetical protein [Streptomyces sp. NPDC102490]